MRTTTRLRLHTIILSFGLASLPAGVFGREIDMRAHWNDKVPLANPHKDWGSGDIIQNRGCGFELRISGSHPDLGIRRGPMAETEETSRAALGFRFRGVARRVPPPGRANPGSRVRGNGT